MACFFSRLRRDRALLVFVSTAFFTLLAVTLRTVAFFTSFDAAIGYFRSGSPLAILTNACILLGAVLSVSVSFLINNKRVSDEKAPFPTPRFIGAALTAFALCTVSLFLLVRADTVPAPTILVLLTALLLLGSATYFLLRLCNAKPGTCAAVGFLAVFAAAFSLAVTYFDRYTPMNTPHKLSMHLCMLAIMFAMLYELRALLGRPMPRARVCTATLAASLCTVCSLSNIVAFIGGVYDDLLYFFFDLLILAFAVYFITQSIRFALPEQEKETEVEE